VCSKINAFYIFVCTFFQICPNSNFYVSQGSAATHWRCGGKYYMAFVGNLVLLLEIWFPAVKEFWKSVKNWHSYRHEFGVHTLCRKKFTPRCLTITLANVDRFSKFFHQVIRSELLYLHTQRLPPHLQYVATLPREIRKSKKSNQIFTLKRDN